MFIEILDRIQKTLPQKNHLVVVTIPDFSVTPTGKQFHPERNVSAEIDKFDDIIKQEAKARGLPVADVFEVSKKMANDPSLVCPDGLHPSAKEHLIWEEIIFQKASEILEE